MITMSTWEIVGSILCTNLPVVWPDVGVVCKRLWLLNWVEDGLSDSPSGTSPEEEQRPSRTNEPSGVSRRPTSYIWDGLPQLDFVTSDPGAGVVSSITATGDPEQGRPTHGITVRQDLEWRSSPAIQSAA